VPPPASVWITSSSWARRICAGSCGPMLDITMTSERIGHRTKMRRHFVPFSGSETLSHTRSSTGFISTMFEFRFSVHTGVHLRSRITCARRRQKTISHHMERAHNAAWSHEWPSLRAMNYDQLAEIRGGGLRRSTLRIPQVAPAPSDRDNPAYRESGCCARDPASNGLQFELPMLKQDS
jgi:hypothetical protein